MQWQLACVKCAVLMYAQGSVMQCAVYTYIFVLQECQKHNSY